MEGDWNEDNWDESKDEAKQQWDPLTDTQREGSRSRRDSLIEEIEEIYGISRQAAEWQLSGWQQLQKP